MYTSQGGGRGPKCKRDWELKRHPSGWSLCVVINGISPGSLLFFLWQPMCGSLPQVLLN